MHVLYLAVGKNGVDAKILQLVDAVSQAFIAAGVHGSQWKTEAEGWREGCQRQRARLVYPYSLPRGCDLAVHEEFAIPSMCMFIAFRHPHRFFGCVTVFQR